MKTSKMDSQTQTPFSLTLKVVLVRPLQRNGSWGTVCERSHSEQFFMAQTAPRVKVVLLLWQLRSAGQFFRARNTNRMYRTTCFAPKVTSSLPFKVRFPFTLHVRALQTALNKTRSSRLPLKVVFWSGPEVHFLDHFDRSHSPKNRSWGTGIS